ncbi:MAG: FAD:protein FMN transferase [Gemmatimonadota bacterium]|nr:FAD:protein FMN transferase [Gemmatimonadota bacterium]
MERWSWGMGQPVHIQAFVDDEARGMEAIAAALSEFRDVEAQLSLFDDASDLCELNRSAGRGSIRAGAHLRNVLDLVAGARVQTRGAFDAAVEPLMRAWGFHAPRAAPPDERTLAEARAAVRAASVRLSGDRVTLDGTESRLDLGGVGVGYGLDRMAAVLRARGVTSALLDVSGDLMAIGAPPGDRGWRIELVDPDRAHALPGAPVVLRDSALATSANTMETVRFGATVVGHVLDPHDGRAAHVLRQVTVVARRAVDADMLSTAALVGGHAVVASSDARVVQAWRARARAVSDRPAGATAP